MNRRKKGGATPKSPALTKPVAMAATASATANTMPTRVSPTPKPPSPPQSTALPPKGPSISSRFPAQTPKPAASPLKNPMPSAPAAKTAAPPSGPVASQKRILTRADRVRAEWMEFNELWVKGRQAEIGARLEEHLRSVERTHQKGISLEQAKDRIIKAARREFAMEARGPWESRLEKMGLQAEDWSDMTPEEMDAVVQVLGYDEEDEDPGVYAQLHPAAPTLSGRTVVEASPPMSSQSSTMPPTHPTAAQKAQAPASKSWFGWATGQHHVAVTEEPEEPPKSAPMPSWGAKNAPIIEEPRATSKTIPEPQTTPSRPTPRAVQVTTAKVQQVDLHPQLTHNLLTYAVPISLEMGPLSAGAAADADFCKRLDNAFINSIKIFHDKAAEADAGLARALTKMPTSDRAITIRAHMVLMEQLARDIVQKRDELIKQELLKRGYGQPNGDAAAVITKPATVQLPGAFPDAEERVHVRKRSPDPEPQVEIEREPEPDVDEVIEIPLKGKAKDRKVAEVKPATTRHSTPTPAPAPAARSATPIANATIPTPEKKNVPVPAASMWGAGSLKTATSAWPASPAPITINTKVASGPAVNGRFTPAPPPLSPWEAKQTSRAAGSTKAAKPKPPSPPAPSDGMWAPVMARTTSNKNQHLHAPAHPSRLANITEPESPEPPSPPPTREPTGSDYVAWFAGSSSEDEGSAEDGGLSENEDKDEDGDEDGNGGASAVSGFDNILGGGMLASLADASPWALSGESSQPQKERARAASPARSRGAVAMPTPAKTTAAGRVGVDMAPHGVSMAAGGGGAEWMRWGAGVAPSSFGARPFGAAAPSGFGTGPSTAPGGAGANCQWQSQGDEWDSMMDQVTKTLCNAAMDGRGNVKDVMAMFVTAQSARQTHATPVGGRAANAWRQ